MFENSLKRQLHITAVVLFMGAVMAYLLFTDSAITGHVSADYSINDVEVVVVKNQSHTLSSVDGSEIILNSVMVTGKIVGDGTASIFLEGNGEKLLIFTNEQRTPPLITGFAVRDGNMVFESEQEVAVEEQIEELDMHAEEFDVFLELLESEVEQEEDKKEVLLDFVRTADGVNFANRCIETCALFGMKSSSYRFVFEVEQGTAMLVDEIMYSIEKE